MSEYDDEKKALDHLAEAWKNALVEGLQPEAMAHAALHSALATLVACHGEAATADAIARLPARILAGEFRLQLLLQ